MCTRPRHRRHVRPCRDGAFAGCAAETDSAAASAETPPTKDASATRDTIAHKTLRIRQAIPFDRETVKTSTLDKGETEVDQEGEPGVRVRVVRLTLRNGVEVGREVMDAFVKRQPVAQVKLVGTRVEPKPKPAPASDCDPNYSGACVPIASDVDCAGGSGDGPEYVQGPVRITGDDIYDLDRDGDDIACDA